MSQTFTMTHDGLEHTWCVETLWEAVADKEAIAIPMPALRHTLLWDCWDGAMSPQNLLRHYMRVLEADLNFPILVTRDHEGVVDHVLDGMHRIVKSFAHGHENIMVKEIDMKWLLSTQEVNGFCDACGCDPCDCDGNT